MRFSVSCSINHSSVHPGYAKYLVLTQGLDPSGDPLWPRHRALYVVTQEHTLTHVSHAATSLQLCRFGIKLSPCDVFKKKAVASAGLSVVARLDPLFAYKEGCISSVSIRRSIAANITTTWKSLSQ